VFDDILRTQYILIYCSGCCAQQEWQHGCNVCVLCYRSCRRWLGSGPEGPIDREIQDKFQGRPHHGHNSLDRAIRASYDSAGGGRLALHAVRNLLFCS